MTRETRLFATPGECLVGPHQIFDAVKDDHWKNLLGRNFTPDNPHSRGRGHDKLLTSLAHF